MKPVQVMLDEGLLQRLDATKEALRDGRSAVIRRATEEYLARRRRLEVRERYEQAYGKNQAQNGELAGWDAEGVWPED